jgi:FAD/FMN-containing dehydrogenase
MRASFNDDLVDLAIQVQGPVLTAADLSYPAETFAWNQAVPQRPLVAVGAMSTAGVQAAVRFANVHGLPIAVIATGHGAVVPADDAVLINIRRLAEITIDHQARTATVGGAVEMQQLIDAAARYGLAPVAGSSPNVGVVGFTLGGGLSPALGRRYGYAADHVREAKVVTADGVLRRVDATHEPDLFWAIRGGKGNFGVVTSMTVELLPVTRLYGGGLFFGGEHARAVMDQYLRLVATAPDLLTVSFALLRLPSLPFVPPPLRDRCTVHVRVAYLGSADEGQRLLAELRAAAPTLIDTVTEIPYTQMTTIHADPVDPLPAYEISALLQHFPETAADALLAAAGPDVDTPVVMVEIRQLGGALAADPEVPNAVGHRDASFQLFAGAVGAPGMHEAMRPALTALTTALRPWATGHKQVNFLSAYDDSPDAVANAYEPHDWERLTRVKTEYDPRNLFRINHNIAPQH